MIFVKDISSRKAAPGQTVSIFGGFFDTGVKVSFGGNDAAIVECDEDMVSAVVPEMSGNCVVTVSYEGTVVKTFTGFSVVELADTPTRNPAKEYTEKDFDSYVRSFFPRGIAFAMDGESNMSKMVLSLAKTFHYVWNTIRSMQQAVDPSHTENYDKWEDELSLPVIGITPSTDAGRLAEIYRKECLDGGCTKAYIKRIISLMGIDAEVYEYTSDPDKFYGVDFGTDDPNFYFKINFSVDESDFTYFTAGDSAAGDYLLDFDKHAEEAVFSELKPSHAKIVFGYAASVIVIGGNSYATKKINNLVWTTENLNEDVGTNAYYNDDESYSQYGRLYNKDDDTYAAIEALLSDGWRIPTLDDFNDLLGSTYSVLDYCTKNEWKTRSGSVLETTNKTGFSLRPAGTKYYAFWGNGFLAALCTKTKDTSSSTKPYYTLMTADGSALNKYAYEGEVLCSVRLCKDA